MTLKFKEVQLDGLMELKGIIHFPENKVVVLYGANQQGKTNIINAIRYAFLREVKGSRKPKKEYDEWALPTRGELVFNDKGTIKVLFEHNNVLYVLERKILNGGRREEPELYPFKSPSQKIDIPNFLKNKLKVSLLDALFAPEIVGGFRQLYSGNIDKSVGEFFREITNLRWLVKCFISRFNRLKSCAEAEIKKIESSYSDFCKNILELCPIVSDWKEYQKLLPFKADEVLHNLESLELKVSKVITKLEEEGLLKDIQVMVEKAKERDRINRSITRQTEISNKLTKLKNTDSDLRCLKRWIRLASQVKDVESRIKTPPKFIDKNLQKRVDQVFKDFTDARKHYEQALNLARKEKIKPEDVQESIRELSKVALLLKKEIKVGREIAASITKIGEKVYTVIDAELLMKDSSLADISKHPIPKGKVSEKKKYLKLLQSKISRLKSIEEHLQDKQTLFEKFVKNDLSSLSKLEASLEKTIEKIKEEIKNWSEDLATLSSSFTGKKIRPRKLKESKDVQNFIEKVDEYVVLAEKRYLQKVNITLKQLDLPQIKELKARKMQIVLKQVSKQIENLPQLKELAKMLQEKKQGWQQKSEEYQDYSEMPPLADEMINILEKILQKCFDEQKLKEKIASTYMDIIKVMQERNLIRAISEVKPQQIRSVVKYKGKFISHPAGSEKAFFTLAILTALAHYFQTPVLIDEVANNLDSTNLKSFFELIKEFKDKYAVQYVLSVKETKDFDFDSWVRDLHDDLEIYKIEDKQIQLMLF
jgi:DNA repair exonuclease SbcCD ATPase subunit